MDFRSHHRRETADTIYISAKAYQSPYLNLGLSHAPTILGAVCYVSTHVGISL